MDLPLRQKADETSNPVLGDGPAAIAKILSSYRARDNTPIWNCAIATVADRGWDLVEADLPDIRWAASLLFLAAWSPNEYLCKFPGRYVNSSSFRVVGQKWSGPQPIHIALVARKRDGSQWHGGYNHGETRFSLPLQCSLNSPAFVDETLLAGLDKASLEESETIERLRFALPFVILANTDDDIIDAAAEAILMGSAFEQLFGSDEKAYALGRLFGKLFEACGNVRVEEAMKVRPIKIDDSTPERALAQPNWWIHRKWIEELHRLRSAAVHEGRTDSHDRGWYPFEHLLMAAHVFPLAVKMLLAREGYYTLSEEDRARCKAVDKLLAVTDWDQDTEDGPRWNQIMAETARSERFENVWKLVQASTQIYSTKLTMQTARLRQPTIQRRNEGSSLGQLL